MDIFVESSDKAIPLFLISEETCEAALGAQEGIVQGLAATLEFSGKIRQLLLVPDDKGNIKSAFFGTGDGNDRFVVATLSADLPSGIYEIQNLSEEEVGTTALALLLGQYRFAAFKSVNRQENKPQFVLRSSSAVDEARAIARGVNLARDLVNTPSSHMGPKELSEALQSLASSHGAKVQEIIGDNLQDQGFGMIHAVGRASDRAPRLIDLLWGDETAPKVTLVGKGVCFDTGGLNLKPGSSMALMKKDMGGAANVIGLASMIMERTLNLRLRVLVPAVENAVGGNAFRPGDVLRSYKGLTVEIENTDAEGRLVLGDALALADEETPDLLIDMATLTGAARVALGPELPPVYTEDDGFADELAAAGHKVSDPTWRMPLWQPYASGLSSKVADVAHTAPGGFAGSITAALFLQKFVKKAKLWAHFDIYAWNPKAKPGRPYGGEGQAIRAIFEVLKQRYG